MPKHYPYKYMLGILILLLFIIFYAIYKYYQTHITTDNAYIHAHAVHIAAQVSGPVLQIFVENNQTVQKGDRLFDIDPKPFIAALDEVHAQILQSKAQLQFARTNLDRVEKLVAKKFLPPEEKDKAVTATEVAAANLKLAEAKLVRAQLNLEYTHVYAPATGIINHFTLCPGTTVSAQVPLFVLINSEEYWVDANFKETELTHMQPKQPAKIVLDMYPNHTFTGVVDSISGSSGTAFSLLPPQNATGNWVKVTQRIPVKIKFTHAKHPYLLTVGATATVTVHTIDPINN